MDAALGLVLALPAARTLVLPGSNWLGGVPVTNTLVALVEEVIIRDIVCINVSLDLSKGPVGQWVDLDEASLVNLDNIQISPLASLAASSSSQDCSDLKLSVSSLCWLDLGNIVVKLIVGVPELVAMLSDEVISGVAAGRLVNVDGGAVFPSYTINESISLVKVIKSVQKDQIDVVLERAIKFGKHVHGDQTGKPKGSGLEKSWQGSNAPSENI